MAEGKNNGFGFWDFIKKPWIRKAMERLSSGPSRPSHTEPLDPEQFRKLVLGLLKKDRGEEFQAVVKATGPAADPVLIEALRDPQFRAAKPYRRSSRFGSPLQLVVGEFKARAVPEALPELAGLLDHHDKDVRKLAAGAVGTIGGEACLKPLSGALVDTDEFVRYSALEGISNACREGRAEPAFRTAAFELVRPQLTVPRFHTAAIAPETLLALDRDRATLVLLAPENFHARNENLYRHLEALFENDIPVPFEQLCQLVNDLRPQADTYPFEYTCQEALIGIGRTAHPEAEAVLRDALAWGGKRVKAGASLGLLWLHGIERPLDVIRARLDAGGVEALTEPQRIYWVLCQLDAQVRNGGFHQYYVNSSGSLAWFAPAAAAIAGVTVYADLIRRANAQFGPDGPPADRDARHDRLAAFTSRQDQTLCDLDKEYYRQPEELLPLLNLYAVQHAEHFRA